MKKALLTALLITCACFGVAQAAQVTLQWDANNPAPEGYRLYQREHGGNYDYSAPVWTGTRTTATIYDLADDTQYYFVVRAYSGTNVSGNSNEVLFVSATPTPTPTPTPVSKPTVEPTPEPTATPAPPRGFVLLKDGAPISSLAPGKFTAQDGGRLWVVDVTEEIAEPAYTGNIITKTFHKVGCRYFGCLTCTAKFSTREDAIAAGFKPCGSCKP